VQIIKLAWVGTRTNNFQQTVGFFRDILGLRPDFDLPEFRVLKLPDGSKVEIFGSGSEMNRHFTTGPVVGFLVDNVNAAASELRARGVEILHEVEDESGNAWVHFRAPDGNIYEFTPGSWCFAAWVRACALSSSKGNPSPCALSSSKAIIAMRSELVEGH
jgi:catechol 2,3-dioxygenase-like lactoylglutathione lyase family enzyme